MRRITIIGNLTVDAETREVGSKKVINFSVAVNEKFNDSYGNKVEKAFYYNCALWRDNSNIAQYLKKGIKVYIEGTPDVDLYMDKSNQPKASIKITVTNISLLSSANKPAENQGQTQTYTETGNKPIQNFSYGLPENDDDLPF